MLMLHDAPYHGVLVRYLDGRRQVAGYDLFFVHDRYTAMIPQHQVYVSALPFPRQIEWLRVASRYIPLTSTPLEYGRGWFRWDEPIRTHADVPCRSVSSRMVDVIV